MDNYNRDFLKSIIGLELSDMCFKQHADNQFVLDTFLVSLQVVIFIVGLIVSRFVTYPISKPIAIINLIILLIVFVNTKISTRAWNKAKDRIHRIIAMEDIIDSDLVYEDKFLHISGIRGVRIKHSDDIYENLVYNWYNYLNNRKLYKKLKYKDSNGNNYHIGDIVYNPAAEDLWLVEELTFEEMKSYNFTTPYILSLYGNKDECVIEINEPAGFKIRCSSTDTYGYIKYIGIFGKAYKFNTDERINDDE